MNIAFWLLVVVVLILVWFCLSFAFRGIGSFGLKLYNDAKDEITGKNEQKEEEENNENEG